MRKNLVESELCLNSSWLRAQAAAQVTLTIPSEANGPHMPVGYVGLSYEVQLMGPAFFSPA